MTRKRKRKRKTPLATDNEPFACWLQLHLFHVVRFFLPAPSQQLSCSHCELALLTCVSNDELE